MARQEASSVAVLVRMRAPLVALLLHLCVVGLLAAAPALAFRASSGGFEGPTAARMRALLQVCHPPHNVLHDAESWRAFVI